MADLFEHQDIIFDKILDTFALTMGFDDQSFSNVL